MKTMLLDASARGFALRSRARCGASVAGFDGTRLPSYGRIGATHGTEGDVLAVRPIVLVPTRKNAVDVLDGVSGRFPGSLPV